MTTPLFLIHTRFLNERMRAECKAFPFIVSSQVDPRIPQMYGETPAEDVPGRGCVNASLQQTPWRNHGSA
jgi:hypothetical protein